MQRTLLTAVICGLSLLPACTVADAQTEEQTLVDRATLTIQELINQTVSQDPHQMLEKARGVMICPRVFKAGFFFGGEGGACVLLARAGNGTWSYPAFFGLGSGSFGLQIGIQDSQFTMMIMTDKGLNAVINSQFKFGADASLAIATLGAGVQGSTTTALGADIIAFSSARGLYGGISLEGSVMGSRTDWNRVYYGSELATRQIVIDMQGVNSGADPLRALLTRYGAQSSPPVVTTTPPMGQSQPGGMPPAGGPAPMAPVQQQNLAPPPASGSGH